MQIEPFVLERYFARHEFAARHLLSSSDCESLPLAELLAMADDETRALWRDLRLGYTESMGHPLLRREIASRYDAIAPDQVLVAAPEEAILIAMNSLLQAGDHVVAVSPAYQSLQAVARAIGCTVEPWPVESAGDHWTVDLDLLARLLKGRPRLVVLNFPHNPTGFLPSRETFERAVAMALDAGAHVFSDEMYRFLEHDPAHRLPSACELGERVVTLGGLSKSQGLPGLRVGWLATRDADVMGRCRVFKDYTTICSSAPSEILAIMGLRAAPRLVERNLGIVRRNLSLAQDFLATRPDLFRWMRPDAGSIAFPAWLGQEPIQAFCDRAVQEGGVMVVPGTMFATACPHFRIGLGRESFPQALAAFASWLEA